MEEIIFDSPISLGCCEYKRRERRRGRRKRGEKEWKLLESTIWINSHWYVTWMIYVEGTRENKSDRSYNGETFKTWQVGNLAENNKMKKDTKARMTWYVEKPNAGETQKLISISICLYLLFHLPGKLFHLLGHSSNIFSSLRPPHHPHQSLTCHISLFYFLHGSH